MENAALGTVTGALGRAKSPLSLYLRRRYPKLALMAGDYRRDKRPQRVPPTEGLAPATLGTAFDTMLSLRLDPASIPSPQRAAFIVSQSPIWQYEPLTPIALAGHAAARQCLEEGTTDSLARGAWVLALLTEIQLEPHQRPTHRVAGPAERDAAER